MDIGYIPTLNWDSTVLVRYLVTNNNGLSRFFGRDRDRLLASRLSLPPTTKVNGITLGTFTLLLYTPCRSGRGPLLIERESTTLLGRRVWSRGRDAATHARVEKEARDDDLSVTGYDSKWHFSRLYYLVTHVYGKVHNCPRRNLI